MIHKSIILGLAVALAVPLAPGAGAHGQPVPMPQVGPCPLALEHHYGAGLSLDAQAQTLPSVSWRTTVALFDTCAAPPNGEGDFGVGGGFLPVDHHGFYDSGTNTWNADICVRDDVFLFDVEFIVGVSPGGGFINEVADGQGCVSVSLPTPYLLSSGPSPGVDGGVWVFLENSARARADVTVSGTPGSLDTNTATSNRQAVPTTGHIYTVP